MRDKRLEVDLALRDERDGEGVVAGLMADISVSTASAPVGLALYSRRNGRSP